MKRLRLAFIGRDGLFSGNCKYLFLASLSDERFSSAYVTDRPEVLSKLRSSGLPARTSAAEIAADWPSADIFVLDDGAPENIKSTFGARPLVQLWHGIGPKMAGLAQINAGSIELTDWHEVLIRSIYCGYDIVCSTSQFGQAMFRNYFEAETFPITGMCRNDVLFRSPTAFDLIGAAKPDNYLGKSNVMLAPTFRESGSILGEILDDELLSSLDKAGFHLILKPHPYEIVPTSLAERVTIIAPLDDVYPMLQRVDIMITDFSSLASDFILLGKPVVHWAPDKDNYEKTCRNMAYDPTVFRLGPWARSKPELLSELVSLRDGIDSDKSQRELMCALLHEVQDGSACERTLSAIAERFPSAAIERGLEPATATRQKRARDGIEKGEGLAMTEQEYRRSLANKALGEAVQATDYPVVRESLKIINEIEPIECLVIGDSHVWGYAVQGIQPVWLGPITMHRVGRDKEAVIQPSELGFDPQKTKLIFNFGEIDARSHVGRQAIKQGKTEVAICEDLVERYISAIQIITNGWPPENIWIATTVPPHNIPETSPHAELNAPPIDQRILSFQTLNQCLIRRVAKSSFNLLDVYNLLVSNDGTLPDNLTNDDIHIYTDEGRLRLRGYCEKLIRPATPRDWLTAQRWTIVGMHSSVAHMLGAERKHRQLTPDEKHYLGRALLITGDPDGAIQLLEEARGTCSEPPWASLYLARALKQQARVEEAAAILRDLAAMPGLVDWFAMEIKAELAALDVAPASEHAHSSAAADVAPLPEIALTPEEEPTVAPAPQTRTPNPDFTNYNFHAPRSLSVSKTPLRNVLFIGSCLAGGVAPVFEQLAGCHTPFILCNGPGQMPASPPREMKEFDFQVIQPLTRSVFNESEYFKLNYNDVDGHRALLEKSIGWIQAFLADALKWNVQHGTLTFVLNFILPQQNHLGRLLPRYDLRNPVYFFEQLNAALYHEVKQYKNVHVIDFDQVVAGMGRQFSRDDSLWALSHGSLLHPIDVWQDQNRIETPAPFEEYYSLNTDEAVKAVCAEILAAYRTVRSVDAVKLVVIDLDDTLWRGIAGEGEDALGTMEGWPLGFMEALSFLKKRGILLAIISKNTEEVVRRVWRRGTADLLSLDDFASVKINWNPKIQNMQEVLRETNLLPKSVVFIDDNPVERAAMREAFPEMRVLGEHLYTIRRTLLWAPETQVPFITDESSRRTEMVRDQVRREESRAALSPEEFKASLGTEARFYSVTGPEHPKFARAFELLNKTNQVNSTGKRWTLEEITAAIESGTILRAFEVSDKFSQYGLVGLSIISDGAIEQFVMSCRVMGMEIETAAFADAGSLISQDRHGTAAQARYVETSANFITKDMLARNGFVQDGEIWHHATAPAWPKHVTVTER